MFFRRGIFTRTILLLLLVAIFASVAGRWSYNAGWSNGYVAAQTTAESDGGEAVAPPPSPRAYPAFAALGWLFAGLVKFWLFLLLIGLGLKLLGWGRWRRHKREGWHHPRWHKHHDHHEPHEKSPEDVQPDIRSA